MQTRRIVLGTVAMALVAAGVAHAAPAEAWSVSVPADAIAVVAVRSIAELDAGLKALLADPGAPGQPGLGDVMVQNLLPGAFETTGPALFVVLMTDDGPQIVTILQGKDPAKLEEARVPGIENLPADVVAVRRPTPPTPPGAPEGFKMPDPPPLFVLTLDRWGVVANGLGALTAFQSAAERMAVGTAAGSRLTDHVAWVHVNPKAVKALLAGLMEKVQTQAGQGGAPAMPPAVQRMIDWYVSLLDHFTAIDLMADLGADGAVATLEAEVVEGSPVVEMLSAAEATTGYSGALPPAETFLLAGWGRCDFAKAAPSMKILFKPFVDALTADGDEEFRKTVEDLWASYDEWGAVLGHSFAFAMDAAPPGQGMYRLVETFEVTDEQQYRDLMDKWMPIAKDMMGGLTGQMGAMPGMPGMTMDMTYEPAAEEIEGVKVDRMRFTVDVQLPEGAPPEAAAQMKHMMDVMYGPEGMVMRACVVNNRAVITLGDVETMARGIRAARGEGGAFTDNAAVAAAVQRIPADAVGQMLLSVPSYVHLMVRMTERMMVESLPEPVRGRAVLEAPPMPKAPGLGDLTALGVYVEGQTVRIRADVPASEVRAARDIGRAFSARMMWIMQQRMQWAQEQQGRMQEGPPAAE
ncbi:MAG: hypothetical protein WBD63_01740 [Phycisphaerae bacterium]|nr:hypothetical protein [Phycisphaerae bacterium]